MSDRSGVRRARASRIELLQEPLARARDLLRVLDDSLDSSEKTRTIDAAIRACEQLMRALPGIESELGRRAFTRELHRAWATILEVRELLAGDALIRVFGEIENAIESTRRMVRRFDEIAGEKNEGYRS